MILPVQLSRSIKNEFLIFLNPFTTISGYLNLQDIFGFIFRELRMTSFLQNYGDKKIIANQMHNIILQRVK